jgi:hypothetical protein
MYAEITLGFNYSTLPSHPHTIDLYQQVASELHSHFRSAQPFPHIIIDDFYPEDLVHSVVEAFPRYENFNGVLADGFAISAFNAQFLKVEQLVPTHPAALFLMEHMRSSPFLIFLEELTGIRGLLPDPHYFGSGLHHTLRGGHLGLHLDYNFNGNLQLWRRINVFLYLNEDWQEEWKGNLELWNADLSDVVVSIAPLFNRLVVFEASETSWHGHPDPLQCPPHVARKSIALYYYTAVDNPSWNRARRETLFMPRRNVDKWEPAQRYDPATE